jgi:hypothetical protein
MKRVEIISHMRDLHNEYSSFTNRDLDFDEWLTSQCFELAETAKLWEDAHAKLEEKLRIEYGAELEAFKIVAEERIRDEYEQKLNEATHADASEITSLRKELDKATLERDSWYGQFKALAQSHVEQGKEIHNLKVERKKIIEKNASMSIQQALNASKLKEAEERATHWYDLYTQQLKRKDQLEEWLQDYQKSLRETNVFHKNEATIHAITEILNESNI